MCRKPTNAIRHLNANFHHQSSEKRVVLNTFIKRAIHVEDDNRCKEEKHHLNSTLSSRRDRGSTNMDIVQSATNDIKNLEILPYTKGRTDIFGRILLYLNLQARNGI